MILFINSVLNLICREFNVNEEWIRNGTGEMYVNLTKDEQITSFVESIQSSEDNSFKKKFLSMLSALNENEWEVLEKMVSMLQENRC